MTAPCAHSGVIDYVGGVGPVCHACQTPVKLADGKWVAIGQSPATIAHQAHEARVEAAEEVVKALGDPEIEVADLDIPDWANWKAPLHADATARAADE